MTNLIRIYTCIITSYFITIYDYPSYSVQFIISYLKHKLGTSIFVNGILNSNFKSPHSNTIRVFNQIITKITFEFNRTKRKKKPLVVFKGIIFKFNQIPTMSNGKYLLHSRLSIKPNFKNVIQMKLIVNIGYCFIHFYFFFYCSFQPVLLF